MFEKRHILIYWENHLSRIHGEIIQYCSLWKNRWAPLVYTCSDSYHRPIIRLLNRGNHLWITQSVGDIWFHHPNLNGTSCRITATARTDLLLLPSEAQKIPTEKGPKSLEPYQPIASGSGWGREKIMAIACYCSNLGTGNCSCPILIQFVGTRHFDHHLVCITGFQKNIPHDAIGFYP